MDFLSDKDVWGCCDVDDLWIYDKLILARKLGHLAGPAGVPVPSNGFYMVRPITNIRMMSRGAYKAWLSPVEDTVPDGYFWSELFQGRHISIDYNFGEQKTTVEGIRNSARLDRFYKWQRVEYPYELPAVLQDVARRSKWLNIEMVGDKIIEVHLRYNDDFLNHDCNEIFPVWRNEWNSRPSGSEWYDSPCGDRLGFWIR